MPSIVMQLVVIKLFKTILTMELILARRVTLQICILYKPEKSVILLSANLGLEDDGFVGRRGIIYYTELYEGRYFSRNGR